MAAEDAADRASMLDEEDFGTEAIYTHEGNPVPITGIYEDEYIETDPQSGVGVSSSQPRFTCQSDDLPDDADEGDNMLIDGVNYTVKVIQPDGTGMSMVILEEV
jgi:hypothetical protein